MAQSPLNYTGGKFKLLPQILYHFPQDIHTFVDLFCGGGDVGTSVPCENVLFNDLDSNVTGILHAFRALPKEETLQIINETIRRFRLSDSSANGYAFYNCDGNRGLGSYNREPYTRLKEYFNNLKERDYSYYVLLYVLIVFSFNNQIRFNKQGKFNLPVGKRDFNDRMQTKLNAFIDRLQEINCDFSNADFRQVDIEQLTQNDFVYAEPSILNYVCYIQ